MVSEISLQYKMKTKTRFDIPVEERIAFEMSMIHDELGRIRVLLEIAILGVPPEKKKKK